MPKKKSNSKNKKKTPAAKVDAGGDPTSIFAPTPDTSGIDIDKPLRSYQGQGSEKHAYDGGGKHTYDGGIRDGRPHQLFPPGIVVFSQEALSATLATRQGHAQDELAAQRRALCEAQRKGYLSYELFAEYNEALLQHRSDLEKKASDLEAKRQMWYGLASRTVGQRQDQNMDKLKRTIKLILNLQEDVGVLNEMVGGRGERVVNMWPPARPPDAHRTGKY
jgi:hypothetical protein